MESKYRNITVYRDYGNVDEVYLKNAENEYDICLPDTYDEFIQKHNGANINESEFDFINKNGEEDTRSIGFFAFGEKEGTLEQFTKENKYLQDPLYYGVKGLIGFASTAEGDTVCFDYRHDPKTCDPKVVVLVHDEYEVDPDGYEHMKVEPVAENFDAFLDMLYEYKDEEKS